MPNTAKTPPVKGKEDERRAVPKRAASTARPAAAARSTQTKKAP